MGFDKSPASFMYQVVHCCKKLYNSEVTDSHTPMYSRIEGNEPHKQNEMEMDSMLNKKAGIKIEGHKGTWYVLDTKEIGEHVLYLLEHEQYGEDADSLIVDYSGKVIVDDVTSGWVDLPNKYEIEMKVNGYLPKNSFPGAYPIYYIGRDASISCAKCAEEHASEIEAHEAYMEGAPLTCEGCNKEIESAYGDPDEDQEELTRKELEADHTDLIMNDPLLEDEPDLNEMRLRLEASESNDHDETGDLGAYGDPDED